MLQSVASAGQLCAEQKVNLVWGEKGGEGGGGGGLLTGHWLVVWWWWWWGGGVSEQGSRGDSSMKCPHVSVRGLKTDPFEGHL